MNGTTKHPLWGLLLTAFTGAFNDNAWKMVAAFLAIRSAGSAGGLDAEHASQAKTTLTLVFFTLPLMLFSLPAVACSDRWSKRTIILVTKAAEVLLMAAVMVVLLIRPSGGLAALIVLALVGVQAAFLSPAKYGILAEILPHQRLSAGNGLLEMWNFLAIIAGTAMGGLLLETFEGQAWIVGLVLTLSAGVGLAGAWFVPRVPAARSGGQFTVQLREAWQTIRSERILRLTVLGLVFYWFVASLVGQDIIIYCKAHLNLPDRYSGGPLATFGVGVGLGSLLAAWLSPARVEYGIIPLGTMGLAVFVLALGLVAPGFHGTLLLMGILGICSGLIVVPLHALLQWRSPTERRGGVIALCNTFVFGSMVVGTLGAYVLSRLGLSATQILLVVSVAVAAGTAWALWLLPDALLRLVLVLFTHTFYRLKVVGRQHLPEQGSALLVPNHVSFIDGLFLLASTDRPIRFVAEARYFEKAYYKPFMKALGTIPIASTGGPRVVLRALRDAGKYLDEGEVVCIFAEGQMTRTGMLLPFRRGFERILRGRSAPIIPVHLDRVWGSIFSRERGRYVYKMPKQVPYPVTVAFGPPLAPGASAFDVRRAVMELGESAWVHRKPDRPPLHRSFIRTVRMDPGRMAFADASHQQVSRLSALTGALLLARSLRKGWAGQRHVGILLPPSVAGALANLAASLAGKVSVNLNYTAGAAALASAARQADLKTVLTSRAFLERLKIDLPPDVKAIWFEDLAGTFTLGRRAAAVILARVCPARLLELLAGAERRPANGDTATIIFSSGSTGDPKGVMLSHFNIDANVEAGAQVLRTEPTDRLMGILPLFHSFGTLSLWLAANQGIGMVFHPSPLDGAEIGGLIERYRVTFLLTTPTFLRLYMRSCTPAQFGSLRLVLTGAERLPEELALAFEDQFGIRPLEGYGATECSPVIATSTFDFRAPGLFQPGARRGFVGHPLPGVAVRVVDLETGLPLPPMKEGLIHVRGPNVMRGYLGRDDLTADVIRDGWYNTGDVGLMDEDGFLRVTDRLSRFSKIGGEMVPHGRVEEILQKASGHGDAVLAVTAVRDEKKGERLAVVHTLDPSEIPAILEKAAAAGLPNLFLPRPDQFVRVDRLPLLGSGKLDLRAVRRAAEEHAARQSAGS